MKRATLRIKIKNKEHLNKIFNIEKLLHEAGIQFDTGYDLVNKIRDWELDWSLKGAKLAHVEEMTEQRLKTKEKLNKR